MQSQRQRSRSVGAQTLLVFLLLGLMLGLGVHRARAGYTGPNRKKTVCGGRYNVYYHTDTAHRYLCTFRTLCGDDPGPFAVRCSGQICRELGAGLPYLQVEQACQEEVLPPATVTGEVQCTGQNGWCQDGAVVHITGQEPLSGYTITGIEGTRDGVQFACPGAVCDVPVSGNGTHTVTYWALSSYGDTSEQGTQQVKVDADAPQMTYSLAPGSPDGANGWYVTQGFLKF